MIDYRYITILLCIIGVFAALVMTITHHLENKD